MWHFFSRQKEQKRFDFVHASAVGSSDDSFVINLDITNIIEAKNIKAGLDTHVTYLRREILCEGIDIPPAFDFKYEEKTDRSGAKIQISGHLEAAIHQLLSQEALNGTQANQLLKKIGSKVQYHVIEETKSPSCSISKKLF